AAANAGVAVQDPGPPFLFFGNLLVSGSVYQSDSSLLIPGVMVLPPGCMTGCAVATNDGTYLGVFNNDLVDPSFGVTSLIFLEQLTPSGRFVNALRVPISGPGRGRGFGQDGMVTSFSSKSELALNLSTSGWDVTFMGY